MQQETEDRETRLHTVICRGRGSSNVNSDSPDCRHLCVCLPLARPQARPHQPAVRIGARRGTAPGTVLGSWQTHNKVVGIVWEKMHQGPGERKFAEEDKIEMLLMGKSSGRSCEDHGRSKGTKRAMKRCSGWKGKSGSIQGNMQQKSRLLEVNTQ